MSDLGLTEAWLRECEGYICEGDDPPPLLAACGEYRHGSASIAGEITDGRGLNAMATFDWSPPRVPLLDPIAEATAVMRRFGWSLLDVSINQVTGFVSVTAEARDYARRKGTSVILRRGHASGRIFEIRHAITLEPGMYKDHWTIGMELGRRYHMTIQEAAANLLAYAHDNGPLGALPATSERLALTSRWV